MAGSRDYFHINNIMYRVAFSGAVVGAAVVAKKQINQRRKEQVRKSHSEMEYYSIVLFDRVTAFKALSL